MSEQEAAKPPADLIYVDTGAAAPLVFFDIVGAYGTMNGLVEIELAARILVPRPDGATEVKFLSSARLRCSGSRASGGLLHVLDLLTHALEFVFEIDDDARDFDVVRLAADRVDLAADFLQEELRLAPDGLVARDESGELLEMAAQSRKLLRDVDAVGEKRDLLQHTLVVEIEFESCVAQAQQQSLAVNLYDAR